MDDLINPSIFESDERFAIGQPVPRSETRCCCAAKGTSAKCTIRTCGQYVAAWMEVTMDECVREKEALSLPK
jgi:hypothetical protein